MKQHEPENKDILLEFHNMTIGYPGRILYENVSFDIRRGDCIMLCGANGSGKTTLLKSIAREKGCDIVMIPTRIPKVPGFTLREFIQTSCFARSDVRGRLSKEENDNITTSIRLLGLESIADKDISRLSDGEFQKASIASALARDASLILFDEPTAFLDAENRVNILNTIKDICMKHPFPAVIFSTHDIHDGMKAASKVLALGADGIFRAAEEDLESAVLSIFSNH